MVCLAVLTMGCARAQSAASAGPEPAAVSPGEAVTPAAAVAVAEPAEPAGVGPTDTTPELGPDGTPTREKLETADIVAGMRGPKAAAQQRCKSLARPREVVRVKLSIAGATGTVETAVAAEDQADSPLVGCVARELRAAVFRRVQKQHTGTSVSVEF